MKSESFGSSFPFRRLKSWRHFWRYVVVVAVVFIALVAVANYYAHGIEARNIELIRQIKIQASDVDGSKLPPAPDKALNDSTIAGIDVNKNYIRDDVELAIFEKYPGEKNLKMRAALLQYTQSLQQELVLVVHKESWREWAMEDSRATSCIAEQIITEDFQEFRRIGEELNTFVESLVFDNELRQNRNVRAGNFIGSYGATPGRSCDFIVP